MVAITEEQLPALLRSLHRAPDTWLAAACEIPRVMCPLGPRRERLAAKAEIRQATAARSGGQGAALDRVTDARLR